MPETQYGFTYGPLDVTRLTHDDRLGYVVSVKCGGQEVVVRCSPKGKTLSITLSDDVQVYRGIGVVR